MEAIERLTETSGSHQPAPDWKKGIMQAADIWKDRQDIPELMEQRLSRFNWVLPPASLEDHYSRFYG
jgi:hypothetical protein